MLSTSTPIRSAPKIGRWWSTAYNANLLDFLLVHQELIPADWKGRFVFFFGTIYRGPNGVLGVPCLAWLGFRWSWEFFWLDDDFDAFVPAVVLAST